MTILSGSRSTVVLSSALVAAVLALGGCSSGPATPREPAARSDVARVLFQGQGPAHLLVGTARVDGSDITYPVADLPGGDQTNPDWSPDGTRIVFAVDDGARDDLWIADTDGSDARILLDCARACVHLDDPDWSPDGASIVYSKRVVRAGTALGSLETVEVETGETTVILPGIPRRFTAGPRWSPDGSRIVYESVHTDERHVDAEVEGVSLRVVTLGASAPGLRLTPPELFAATADWSPDGRWIVFSALARSDSEAADLFVVGSSGGERRQLTRLADAGGYAVEPGWFADSERIVFSGRLADRSGSPVLLTVDADGDHAPTQMGSGSVIGRHPRIEPGA